MLSIVPALVEIIFCDGRKILRINKHTMAYLKLIRFKVIHEAKMTGGWGW